MAALVDLADKGNGAPVRPDRQTKTIMGVGFGFAMAVMGFLALQVWVMNAKMSTLEANQTAQQRFNDRIERAVEKLSDKIDKLSTTLGTLKDKKD